jgi:hypothetical protein
MIHFCGILLHIFICAITLSHLGRGILAAAWAKNISDSVCCLALYLYIVIK